MVDQELLARNEYLAAENRILKSQLKGRVRLSDAERATLGEIGHRLGRKVLGEVANVARPDTILAWYRNLVARKFDGTKARRTPGRPRIKREVEQLIVRMAEENPDWGYDRIAGTLANLGYEVCVRGSAMSCNATLCRPHPSASARPPGRPSFGPIWRCWRGRTSSRRRSSPCVDW
ncbi:MAG TPA: helix-turn-helix domain-containing protein [Xanthobacteraceae bacterium]